MGALARTLEVGPLEDMLRPRSARFETKRNGRWSAIDYPRKHELLKLEARLLDLVRQAVAEENGRWNSNKLTVNIDLIGDRPAGIMAPDSPIVQAALKSVPAVAPDLKTSLAGSSTDSNQPMSPGIPSVTTGGDGEGGNWHSRNE